MSVKIKSVKLMSGKLMSGKNIGPFQSFSKYLPGISDLRLVDNCLKMTVYVVIGDYE